MDNGAQLAPGSEGSEADGEWLVTEGEKPEVDTDQPVVESDKAEAGEDTLVEDESDEGYYQEHPTIYLMTEQGVWQYAISSVYTTEAGGFAYEKNFQIKTLTASLQKLLPAKVSIK